jgi:hypothetical protein
MALISDPAAIAELRTEWEGAGRMRARMLRHVRGAFARLPQPGLADVVYNIPVLLAFDVLNQALRAIQRQIGFRSASNSLGHLMDGAKDAITWIDYPAMLAAKNRRNEIAHDGKLHPADVCLSDIANVEKQLHAWNVLHGDIRDPDSYGLDE